MYAKFQKKKKKSDQAITFSIFNLLVENPFLMALYIILSEINFINKNIKILYISDLI